MSTPRLEIDVGKIHYNASVLVKKLAPIGISVTGVTKAILGSPKIANAMLKAGASALGDSRIENIESMRQAAISSSMSLIRSPMLSQADRVVRSSDISFNTELEVISKLSSAAKRADRIHGIVLMVELGDLREGIIPKDIESILYKTLKLPNIAFRGIGANLACRSGVSPSSKNMGVLSSLAESIEETFDLTVDIVSGGNSANLHWALSGVDTGRINNLRLGEAILLGREPLYGNSIDGLFLDAITLVSEVIESKIKPSQPYGEIAQTSFGIIPCPADRGSIRQIILALGHQDTDPGGLVPPSGVNILGASSDHLILDDTQDNFSVGSEVTFHLNYSALIRAIASPFVAKIMKNFDI